MFPSGKKIGVDAGSAMIKLVELGKSGGAVALANWSALPFRVPPNTPPEAARQVQAKAIDAAIKKSRCKCRDVVVGAPGNNAFIRNIKLPPIPSSKIDQIVRYEIQQTIPFPIENIALDYQVLEPDESSEVEVIMVAMKGEVAENFIRDIEQAKVNVGIVDSIPLALYNCYVYNEYSSKEDCTAIVEIGASTSNILIELGGEMRYCRSVGIGGNDITNAIAKEFNIPFEQAERIKIQSGLIFPESQEAKFSADQVRVSKTVTGVLDRLLGEIKLTIGYFRSLSGATAISRAVIAGGTSMLKNIRPFFADRLGVKVEILNPLRKVAVPENLANAKKIAPLLATAVGLALRSSQECCQLKISLIPPAVRAAKSRRTKLILNVVNVLLLLGIVGLFLWRMIPAMDTHDAMLAALDKEIARYEQFEDELKRLRNEKALLSSEYVLYSKYPKLSVDPLTPMAILADTIQTSAWVKSITVGAEAVTVSGSIKSDTKVEELRQLSNLRLELEKYCTEVKVKQQQKEGSGPLNFVLELRGVPELPQYLAKREAEREAEEAEEAKEEASERAEEATSEGKA